MSLLGFLSRFIARIPFRLVCLWYFLSQFSFRSLCHFQSSIWHLLLLFIQYVVPPFWDRFSWCVASFVLMCGASFWSCISHFLYFAVRVFSVCVLLRISCSLSRFYSRSLLLTFSFPQLVPVFGNFLLYFFVCSSMLYIEVKTLVFSSLFPRALLFSRLSFSWHFKPVLKC